MSISLTIGGTVIDVPNTSENPNWGNAMVAFFRAVESALASALGPYDVPPQVMSIDGDSYNPASSPVNINGLSFSTSTVRAAFIEYSVYRDATAVTGIAEAGKIIVVYNTDVGAWSISEDHIGDASITFSIDSAGQVQFTTTALGTTPHTGKISFKATALTNS
jgi:hypothetical protein